MMRVALQALLCLAVVAGSARAQLGGLIRKAAGKLEQKIEKKVEQAAGLEGEAGGVKARPLEGDPVSVYVLEGVLKGLAFERQQQAEAITLTVVQRKKADAWNAATAAHGEADRYRTANSTIVSCIDESIAESMNEHYHDYAMQQVASGGDPGHAEKTERAIEVFDRVAAAAAKNDTAGVRRLTGQLMRVIGADPAKDSVVAIKKCGTPPKIPAAVALSARLGRELRDANEDLRRVEIDLSTRAAAAAGLAPALYFQARERIWAWNSERKEKAGSRSVTKAEDALFKSRAADIAKVEDALR